jgi:aldehyde dehydrogenase (NAD+)
MISPRDVHASLRAGFTAGLTRAPASRVASLRALRSALAASEDTALAALRADLGKHRNEALLGELSVLYGELNYFIDGLQPGGRLLPVGGGGRPRPESTAVGEARSVEYVPRGVCLQIAPFNFPLQLALRPLIGALAAGNCVVVKPSELTPETEKYIAWLVAEALNPRVCAVVRGGKEAASALLELEWDHVTYTGGGAVGRVVAAAAAQHLTPMLLELGGKNPAVVTASADVEATACSVAFARWFNAGQVCLAVEYVLAEEVVYDAFVVALLAKRAAWYGEDPSVSPSLARIVNGRHFDRIVSILDATGGKVLAGGERESKDRFIAPTVVELTLEQAVTGDALMTEEVFGPVLAVIKVPDLATAAAFIGARDKPLALYIYARDAAAVRTVLDGTDSGSVVVNFAMSQAVNENGWLGGIGASGMGGYGYTKSLETYSHQRQVYTIAPWRARKLGSILFQPAWTNRDGSQSTQMENGLRLYTGMPFKGGSGAPPFERVMLLARASFFILAGIAVAVLVARGEASKWLETVLVAQVLVVLALPLFALAAAEWALARRLFATLFKR